MEHRSPRRLATRLGIGLLAAGALGLGGNAAFAAAQSTPAPGGAAAAANPAANAPANPPANREARNERIAVEFMELAINEQRPQEAADLYMGDTFIQHNPQNPDGKEAFVAWANGLIAFAPEVNVDIKRTLADGDLVTVHSHFTTSPTDRGFAVVDMFRLERGKIVEHWDVIQAVPETAANDNTMF